MKSIIGILVGVSFLFSCSTSQVGSLEPEPKMKIGRSYEVLEFQMGSQVQQNFKVPQTKTLPSVTVSDYRKSLIHGFLKGYKKHFK